MGVEQSAFSGENVLETFTNKDYLLKSIEPMLELRQSMRGGASSHRGRPIHSKYKPQDVTLHPKKRVSISDLEEEETLIGKYLLCRVIAPPTQLTAIVLIVDDPKGVNALRMCLYEFHEDATDMPSLEEIFPVGTILAVHHPWFKRNLDGGYSLRVEGEGSLSIVSEKAFKKCFPDLVWKAEIPEKYQHLQKNPPFKKTENKTETPNMSAIDWKVKGNTHFVNKEYKEAYDAYTKGLKIEPGNVDILSNRAATGIHLGYFYRALEDCDKTLSINPVHLKGIYRKAKSLAGLERYEEAITLATDKMSQMPELRTEEFKQLAATLRVMEKQRSTGTYDLLPLFTSEESDHKDFADFLGPVEIADVVNKGRGLVAKNDIPVGTLIILSKAFGIVYDADLKNELAQHGTNRTVVCRKALVANVMEKLKMEPEHEEKFSGLHKGKDFSPETEDGVIATQKTVHAVCIYNAVTGETAPIDDRPLKLWFKKDADEEKSLGLWIMPSYINHSCWDANCFQETFGNIMIIRSIKNIPKGEEILIPYITPTATYFRRANVCKRLGFICYCTLCKMERDAPKAFRNERRKIFEKIIFNHEDIFKLKNLVNRLDNLPKLPEVESYGARNTTMLFALDTLGINYLKKFQFDDVAEIYIRAYNLAKETPLIRLAIQNAINIVAALLCAKKKKLAKKWRNILEKDILIAYGPQQKEVLKILAKDTPLFGDKEYWRNFEEIREMMTWPSDSDSDDYDYDYY